MEFFNTVRNPNKAVVTINGRNSEVCLECELLEIQDVAASLDFNISHQYLESSIESTLQFFLSQAAFNLGPADNSD